jgi:hypothetical protein
MRVGCQLHAAATLPNDGTHWIRSWVELVTDLDAVEKRKSLLLPGIDPLFSGTTARKLSTILAEDSILSVYGEQYSVHPYKREGNFANKI